MSIVDITNYRYTYPQGILTERIKSIKFGSGYEQRALDGLNPRQHEWEVTFPAIGDFVGQINSDLISLYDALLSPDPVFWISPYDLLIAKSRSLITQDKLLLDLNDLEREEVRNTYIVKGSIDTTMENDKYTTVKCRLKRYYGRV